MKPMLAAVLVFAALQGLPPLISPLIPDATGIVTGVIRRADTGQPLPEAQVVVAVPGDSIDDAMTRATVTDLNGRFTIKGVQPGDYILVAQCEGFFALGGEIPGSTRASAPITVIEGQQSDGGLLELIPGSAISGRVTAPDGQLLTAATVQALRASYIRGRRAMTLVKSIQTDDRGEYRLFWLPPGEYYIRGQYRVMTADRTERYDRVFFPSVFEEDAAPSIVVRRGAEVSGIDVRVPVTPIVGVTISGRITNAEEGLPDVRITAVHLVPRGRRVLVAGEGADAFHNAAADLSQGRFEIRNVPPGEYDLFPVDGDGNVRTPPIPVNVADRNIENISGVLAAPIDLRVRVTLDGRVPRGVLQKDAILLSLAQPLGIGEKGKAVADEDGKPGEFLVPRLLPGHYALQLAPMFRPPDVYVADLIQGGRSVFDSGFTIDGESRESLDVVLRSQGGVVEGTVLDSTRLRPFSHAIVALVPESARRQNLSLYRHAISAANGRFRFAGISPGSYKVFAWGTVIPGAWENALFLQRFEDRASSVIVESGYEKNVQVNVIP